MTEAQSPQYTMANAVVANKRVYMRAKDMEDIEKELETSRLAAENASMPSAPASEPENPNSANESVNSDNWQKRYADLQSDRDKKLAEAKKKENELTQKNLELENKLKETLKSSTKYPTSEEELEQWCKEFPPLVGIIQTLALKAVENSDTDLKNKLTELEEFKKAYANEKGRLELLKLHPDANEIETDPRFAQWYNEQETEIQQLIDSGNPKKIAKAISIFKKDFGIVTKTVQDYQKEASKAVNFGNTPPDLPKTEKLWYESQVSKMTHKQYALHEKEIELARMQGRYVYDISRPTS